MTKDLSKSWAIGLLVTLIFLGISVVGTHTPLEFVAILLLPLMIPAYVLARAINRGELSNAWMYGLMVTFGSLFYGAMVLLLVRYRARKRRQRATASGSAKDD